MDKLNQTRRFARRARMAVIFALAAICLAVPALVSAQQLTGTFVGKDVGRDVAFSHSGKARNNWAGTLKFKIDNGPELRVFCIQIDVRVTAGNRYRSDGPVLDLPNGCQIRYLLDKYPASTASDADEGAARQMAIWVFSDGVDPATIADAKIRDRTIALVNEAKKGPCPGRRTTVPDLTLDPPVANAAVGQTVAYTLRASAEDAGQTATVAVTGPAVLTDETGQQQNGQQQSVTLDGQSTARFWVTSTGAGQTNVNVALPYRLEAGTVFDHIEGSQPTQRLVMAESQNLVANASAQAAWSAQAPSPSAPPTETPAASTETPAAATETPAAPIETPAPPTATPKHHSSKSPTETPTEQSSPSPAAPAQSTAVAGEQATTTAQGGGEVTPTATPAAGQPAGGAAPQQPRNLPRTGDSGGGAGWLILAIAGLLVCGGWLMRRRMR